MKIDPAQLKEQVRALAKEYPDRIYNDGPDRCKYHLNNESATGDGPPEQGCGIGVGLQRLGVPLDMLKRMDDIDESSFDSQAPEIFAERVGLDIERDVEVLEWLGHFQYFQDGAKSWGEAVKEADDLESIKKTKGYKDRSV